MTIVEADGHYVEPIEVENLYIYSGETYSVLVKANQDPSRNYWLTSNAVGQMTSMNDHMTMTLTGLAIFNYYPNSPNKNPPTMIPTMMDDDIAPRLAQSQAIKARQGGPGLGPPTGPDRVIMLLIAENMINGYMKWAVNNVSLTLPTTPYLVALKEKRLRHKLERVFDQKLPPNSYDWQNYDIYSPPPNDNAATTSNNIYRLNFNSTVDIVLQNSNMMDPNTSETHPWHLHGHDFWVLGYGLGKFDPFKDPKKFNLDNPIMKNTVPLYPYGWTAIRFRADNPGVWLFHCHIESDFALGMGVVFEEGISRVGKLPVSIMGCGLTKGLIAQ